MNTQVFNITFLCNCADSKLEIPDKSIASDQNQPHFRIPLSIQWSKDSKKIIISFQNMLCESWIDYHAGLDRFPAVVFIPNPSIN